MLTSHSCAIKCYDRTSPRISFCQFPTTRATDPKLAGVSMIWGMLAGKKRLAGDIVRQANTSEVTELRREARDLKEVVAEQTLELRLLKKSMLGDGGDLE